jgi:hypothetical protein
MSRFNLDGLEIEVGKMFLDDDLVSVESAYFVDNGRELSESDLDRLATKYAGEFYQDAMEDKMSRAYDMAKDRND